MQAKMSQPRSKSRCQGHKFWYWWKGLVTRNTHVKYETPACYGLKVIINVKAFKMHAKCHSKGQSKCLKVKYFGNGGKVLSQGIPMWNMKVLTIPYGSNVMIKILIHLITSIEAFQNLQMRTYTHTSKFRELWSPAYNVLLIRNVGQRSRWRSKILILSERSCHQEYTCKIWNPCLLRFKSYDKC